MSLVGFKARNHRQQVGKRGACDETDDRRTPVEIFAPLERRHSFTLDAAASSENAKCPAYFTRETNGLEQSWAGQRVWCNPPYSDLWSWTKKALTETRSGRCPLVVMLLPANRCEQKWWQHHVEPYRNGDGVEVQFLAGRPRFGWPEDRVIPKKGDRPPFGLVIVTFRGAYTP